MDKIGEIGPDDMIEGLWAELTFGVGEDGHVIVSIGHEEGMEAKLADALQEIVDELRAELGTFH